MTITLPGTLLHTTTTDGNGCTASLPDGYEFYAIIESDPLNYISVGALDQRVVREANWIEIAYRWQARTSPAISSGTSPGCHADDHPTPLHAHAHPYANFSCANPPAARPGDRRG